MDSPDQQVQTVYRKLTPFVLLLPLAPISAVTEAEPPGIIQRMGQRLRGRHPFDFCGIEGWVNKNGANGMHTIRVLEKTDKDGTLLLRIPLGKPEAEYEVVVVVQPKEMPGDGTTLEQRGWPPGYFENTFGSITDETFARPPQGELPKPVELDLE